MLTIEAEFGSEIVLRGDTGYIKLGSKEQLILKDWLNEQWPEEDAFLEEKTPENTKQYSHYFKRLPEGVKYIDIYMILDLWEVTSQGIGHAIKKLFAPGKRHSKSYLQDITEARDTLNRVIEIETSKGVT